MVVWTWLAWVVVVDRLLLSSRGSGFARRARNDARVARGGDDDAGEGGRWCVCDSSRARDARRVLLVRRRGGGSAAAGGASLDEL
jgi:hypothetical protein